VEYSEIQAIQVLRFGSSEEEPTDVSAPAHAELSEHSEKMFENI